MKTNPAQARRENSGASTSTQPSSAPLGTLQAQEFEGQAAPAQPARLSELGLIILTEIYDRFTEKTYEEAIGCFDGLSDLIAHHPALQPEAKAMRQIVEAERVLNTLRGRKYAL